MPDLTSTDFDSFLVMTDPDVSNPPSPAIQSPSPASTSRITPVTTQEAVAGSSATRRHVANLFAPEMRAQARLSESSADFKPKRPRVSDPPSLNPHITAGTSLPPYPLDEPSIFRPAASSNSSPRKRHCPSTQSSIFSTPSQARSDASYPSPEVSPEPKRKAR